MTPRRPASSKRSAAASGFTLVETLSGLAVLALLGAMLMHLLSRMAAQTDGVRHRAEARLAVRPVMSRLLTEISAASSLPREVRAVSFTSSADRSRLALALPRTAVRQETLGGALALVVYEWDAESGNLIRAELHPSGSSAAGEGGGEGMERLRSVAPALRGGDWSHLPGMMAALVEARRQPLLTGVLRCDFRALERAGDRPSTGQPVRQGGELLPAAVAITLGCAVDTGSALARDPERALPFTAVVALNPP